MARLLLLLGVVGGDPLSAAASALAEIGGRRCVHRDQGGHPHEHELAWRKRIALRRRGGEFDECVKDG